MQQSPYVSCDDAVRRDSDKSVNGSVEFEARGLGTGGDVPRPDRVVR
jgi:hypothetical protein